MQAVCRVTTAAISIPRPRRIPHSSSALDLAWERFNLLFVYSPVILNRSTIMSFKYRRRPVCARHVQCNTVTALSPNRKSFHRSIDSLSSTSCFPFISPRLSLLLEHLGLCAPCKSCTCSSKYRKPKKGAGRTEAPEDPQPQPERDIIRGWTPRILRKTAIDPKVHNHRGALPCLSWRILVLFKSSGLPSVRASSRDLPGYLPRVSSNPSRVWRPPSAQTGDQDFQDTR